MRRGFSFLVSIWLGVMSALSALGAQAAVDPSMLQALQWRLVGPFRGGRVLAVTGIAGDSRHFYFGAVDGGVWSTEDAGRTWQPIFDNEPAASIGALAVAPSAPSTLYVGTGEADMRSDIAHGAGMYKSVDAGKHWTFLGLSDTRQIGRILVDPRDPEVVFVAALGHAYGPNAERGVFRSKDGGAHWSKVLFENPDTGAIDLAFKPGAPDTIYAALWQTRRPPWSVYPPSSGPGSGLYVSHDGGDHWSAVIGNGFPAQPGRIGLAVAPSEPERLYALVDAAPPGEGGLYRSDDGGVHWSHVSADSRIFKRGWYFSGLTVDPKNAERLYVMNTIVLRSEDGGKNFIALKGDPTGDDFHALWIDPTDSERQILGVDQGALITLDGGTTWSSWYNQPTAQIYHVSTDNRFPYWLYGAQQDSGAVALPSRTDSVDGITMQQFRELTAGGESGMIAPDPDHPNIVYGEKVDKLDTRTGQTRNIDPTLAYPEIHHRSAWTLPLAFSRRGKRALYFADQHLYRTLDGGDHWTQISPDLTRPDAGIPSNLDAPTAADDDHVDKRRGVIYTIAPSTLSAAALWVGTDDGLVWRSDDAGAHWREVTPRALTPWSKVAGIELSHFDPVVAYLAIDRHRLDDDEPYIYRTQDGGKEWVRIDAGIPRDSFVNVIREDPAAKGLLYAGTERGMFMSLDDGAHWQPLQQNLPMTSVRDIDVHGDDLVIATHGRGFWIMDDVSALRQMGTLHADEAILFKPATAFRVRPSNFTGTPMPKDEPLAANPPDGAIIDYALPAAAAGPVTLTILDAHDNTVRRFSSTDIKDVARPVQARVRARMGAATRGALHHARDASFRLGSALLERGAGHRGAAVTAGSLGTAWAIRDRAERRRKEIPPTARGQGRSARDHLAGCIAAGIYADAADRAGVGARIERIRRRRPGCWTLSSRGLVQSTAPDENMVRLRAKASIVSGVPPHSALRNIPPLRTDSLRTLAADLDKLEGATDGADADPGPDVRASFATLSRMLTATLSDWQTLLNHDLVELNAQLKAAGEPLITM